MIQVKIRPLCLLRNEPSLKKKNTMNIPTVLQGYRLGSLPQKWEILEYIIYMIGSCWEEVDNANSLHAFNWFKK